MTTELTIVCVELHDARIERIIARTDGRLEVVFRHISVILREPGNLCACWSYSGLLQLTGVSEFSLAGEMNEHDYVTDGSLTSPVGDEIELSTIVDHVGGPGRFQLTLAGSGTQIRSNFFTCCLTDLKAIKRLEEWREE